MARLFNGTTDRALDSNSHTLVATRSMSAWIRPITAGEGGAGRAVQFHKTAGTRTNESAVLFLNAGTGANLRFGTQHRWSDTNTMTSLTPDDSTTVPASAWSQVGFSYSGGAVGNRPILYVNGVTVTPSHTGIPVGGSLETSFANCCVGNEDGATRTFDGSLAEIAVWNRILTSSEFALLGKGYSPFFLMRGLVRYYPMIGQYSPEIDPLSATRNLTLTGTATSAHPLVFLPRRRMAFLGTLAAGIAPAAVRVIQVRPDIGTIRVRPDPESVQI